MLISQIKQFTDSKYIGQLRLSLDITYIISPLVNSNKMGSDKSLGLHRYIILNCAL
jgi:hypothetical protein